MSYADLDAPDADGYVPLGVAASKIGQQTQYFCHFLTGWSTWTNKPDLDDGIRWHDREATGGNYHAIRIHQDDVDTFVERVRTYYRERGLIK